jgi:hypothetical protein
VGYENCAQPQIWMAGIIVDADTSLDSGDRSFPAFWLPFQDVNAHNFSAQWVEQVKKTPPGDGGTGTDAGDSGSCGAAGASCSVGCCTNTICCGGQCADFADCVK